MVWPRRQSRAVSTGGYHNAQAPMALDMLTAAYAILCVIAERMSAKMLDANVSLLPPNLNAGHGQQQLGEGHVLVAIRVDRLPQQLHFAIAPIGKLLDFL